MAIFVSAESGTFEEQRLQWPVLYRTGRRANPAGGLVYIQPFWCETLRPGAPIRYLQAPCKGGRNFKTVRRKRLQCVPTRRIVAVVQSKMFQMVRTQIGFQRRTGKGGRRSCSSSCNWVQMLIAVAMRYC